MVAKTQIELRLLLPTIADERDKCVERLNGFLQAKTGIEAAHQKEDQPGQICIHYDANQLSISEVRQLAQRAGAELEQRFGHLLLETELFNARRANIVESRAQRIEGVLEASISLTGRLRIEFDRQVTDEAKIRRSLEEQGVWNKPLSIDEAKTIAPHDIRQAVASQKEEKHDHAHEHKHEHGHAHGGVFGENTELIFAGIAGVLLLVGWLLTWTSVTPWMPWLCYFLAYIAGGYFAFREAIESVLEGRFEIDFLMLVAAIGAAALGEWFEGALLLFLFSIGHALENYAMGRAKRAIESLAELAPQTALVKRNGTTEELPIEKVQVGDTVIVKPNDRLPSDGFIIKGVGSINQAPITGESVPAEKRAVDDLEKAGKNPDRLDPQFRVFAGTINGGSAFEIQVTKLASESTLARVVQMVNEAETKKSPTQLLTKKVEGYFVPVTLVFVFLLLFAGLNIDEPFSSSFYRAMAVLVAASPCALAIATPSAVLSGVARAARGGVLVKGGGPLESLGKVSAIAFDKTGTLTEGKPRLTDVVAATGSTNDELLQVSIAVEMLSDHPLAAAIVNGGKDRLKEVSNLQAKDVQSITGRGVKAMIDGDATHIGKESLFDEIEGPRLPAELHMTNQELKAQGRTTVIVRKGDRYLGILGLMDTPRESAKSVIAELKKMGIQRMVMLSGDNQQVASVVAAQVGLSEVMGDLMPDDKVEAIRKLASENGVAMVGDGVNDAPAMANATVGIAMGAAGSDVALETADVALMGDDLKNLPFAIGLSRQTSRIIRQNLWGSLGMVAFLIPATLFGLQMGPAVLLHEGSTLLVVFNALRLLAYRAE